MATVSWSAKALDQLAAIWTTSGDRAAVNSAAENLDARLRSDPRTVGESRGPDERIVFEHPLVSVVRVKPDGSSAIVLTVRVMTRRRPEA